MASVTRLIHEIHRRSLWQVLGIYLVGAWLAYQVILALVQGVGLPAWVPGFAIVLFLIGLPIVLATAFVQEGGPTRETFTGARSDSDAAPGAAAPGADADAGRRAAPGPPTSGPPASELPVRAGAAAPGLRRALTWRRSLVAGVVAFALLGAGTGAYSVMRVLGIGPAGTLSARGIIDEGDPILLSDFETTATDPQVGRVVTEALRIDLLQSAAVRLAGPSLVEAGLLRMNRDLAGGLPEPVARELAEREGWKAVIAGEVSSLGGGYVLAARIVAAEDGTPLEAFREAARDSTELIDAVDRLSKRIRERVGESLRSIHAAEPLPRVSTASLPALRRYAEATALQRRGGDQARVAELLEEAVALDEGFATAWRALGTVYGNLGVDRVRTLRALEAAYELRERLPARERYLVEASFYSTADRGRTRAIQAYRRVLEVEPDNGTALNNLGVLLIQEAEFGEAEAVLRRGTEIEDTHVFTFRQLARIQYRQGRTEEALATLERAVARLGENYLIDDDRLHFLAAERRWADVEAAGAEMLARYPGHREARRNAFAVLLDAYRAQGRLREAEPLRAELDAAQREAGSLTPWAVNRALEAELSLLVRGDRGRALRELDQVLADPMLDGVAPDAWPLPRIAAALALAGEAERAERLLSEWDAAVAEREAAGAPLADVARARIALARGRTDAAIASVRRALAEQPLLAETMGPIEMARIHDMAGRADSARAYYERYLAGRDAERVHLDAVHLADALVRLAELYEDAGDAARAAGGYRSFIDLWRDADPELQPRVEAARRSLERLVARGG